MEPIIIPDTPTEIAAADRIYPPEYNGHFSHLLIKREDIIDRATNLARAIHEDYKGKRPVLLCVLKGASSFYLHLLEALQDLRQGFYTEFIRLSSYEGSETTGKVKVGGGLNYSDLTGKDLIVVKSKADAKYIGFSIPPQFVIGFGLDYNELYRDLKDIWVISQQGIDFDPKQLHK
ncbi:hypothetical protein ACHAWC_010872 [Mediolabrus comicus]